MLKLRDILKPEAVIPDLLSTDKKGILQEFSTRASKLIQVPEDDILNILMNREKLGSTAVGQGVAIPHGKISGLEHIVAFFGRSQKGVDFQAHDGKASHIFFVILAPETAIGNYLHALARLSRLMKENRVRQRLINCAPQEIYDILITEDDKL